MQHTYCLVNKRPPSKAECNCNDIQSMLHERLKEEDERPELESITGHRIVYLQVKHAIREI